MPERSPSAMGSPASPAQESSAFAAPQISLPKGGGAIRGIGEKFTANTVTGTGTLTVPIATSPGRSGFGPQLSLSYDSGAGNGVFAFGWSLGLPVFTRKTDKGLPQYQDPEESDVFLLSGAEDLVRVLKRREDGRWTFEEFEQEGYSVKRYRPRIEGLFARIERWTRLSDGDTHWQSISKDNILTLYGKDQNSRIADPGNPRHVFSWLICASFDDKGNAIVYEYAAENDLGVDLARLSERHRVRTANRYPKRIRYGNRHPLLLDGTKPSFRKSHIDELDLESADWMFEMVFDFGEEDYHQESPDHEGLVFVDVGENHHAERNWLARRDPFSNYRAAFEVRTHRLCRRVLMFHRFPEELEISRYLVRSTEFEYEEKPMGSFLKRVTQSGYKHQRNGRYLKKSLPPLDLSYTSSPLENESFKDYEVREVEPTSLANLPEGIDGGRYQWVDLDGEGISGVLSEQGHAWFYKPNLGSGRFGTNELVSPKPSLSALRSGRQQLLDIAGDGNQDLVDLSAGTGGFFERTWNGGWGRFRAFHSLPVLNWQDPNLRFVDLTGDGIADVLVTGEDAFTWHPSLLGEGFGSAVRVPTPHDETQGPRIVFADSTQSIYLADMSGDGLSDIVRIRNGEVCYWPNNGYGCFGRMIRMDNSPWFDTPNQFNQQQIRLADTDGSGTTDILYLGDDGIHVYLNESGNSWSERRILRGIPTADPRSISVTDFLGQGTACLVWSSPLPTDSQRPLRYADLMCGQKPHLLTHVVNNLGAETVIEYASSTEFYLEDKAAGQPWVTRLPFPVHVVKRVETFDHVTKNRFITTASYHHGHYDAMEREFHGFGRVDQIDTEEFGGQGSNRRFPATVNEELAWRVPPILTKTWYHTGAFIGANRISRHLAHEYYREPNESSEMRLDDTLLPAGLTPEEAREGCRALKGSILRQEVYALDRSEKSARPYTIAESNATVRMLQPRQCDRHSVFFAHGRESLTVNYERKLYEVGGLLRADPRVAHTLTLEVDSYGNILRSVSINYGRRYPERSPLLSDADRAKQSQSLFTLTENEYTNSVDESHAYRNPVLARSRTYELVHLRPRSEESETKPVFPFDELRRQVARASDGIHELAYEDVNAAGATRADPYRRLIQESRNRYRSNDLNRLLPVGELESLALPGESYALALTPGLLTEVYREKLPQPYAGVLHEQCGYVDLDGDGRWWVPSGRVFFSPESNDDSAAELVYGRRHFYLPHRFKNAFGKTTSVAYDVHDLAVVETRDAMGNLTQAELNYVVLQPRLVTDINGNRSEAAFDALGMVAGTALMGKIAEQVGDSLVGFVADLPELVVLEHLHNPLANPPRILGDATARLVYDLHAFVRTRGSLRPQPVVTYGLARETHRSELVSGRQTKMQHTFSYSDGLANEVQRKIQAEPGPISGEGKGTSSPRWVGSGWTIFNNKGKPVRQYEPFFTATHHFEFAVAAGVAATLLYDPAERVVAKLHPNHTFEKTVFDPWHQEKWDANDTVLLNPRHDPDIGSFVRDIPAEEYQPTWYEQRYNGGLGRAEQDAARKTSAHAQSPSLVFADTLGRTFLSIDHNRFPREDRLHDEFYAIRSELDIQGNLRSVTDALTRVIVTYDYDVGGGKIHKNSTDAAERWIVNDIARKPIFEFDSREHRQRREYDELRRPTTLFVRIRDNPEKLVERTEYGESHPDPVVHNLRGRLYRQFDGAGVVTSSRYDFKGNLLRSSRQMLTNYRDAVDWSSSPTLEKEVFYSESSYDALNRPVTLTAPDHSVLRPSYNEANLLERLDVSLKGVPSFSPFVSNIDYNSKGQRELVEYGNDVRTTAIYDPLTFRLVRLTTTRRKDAVDLQDLTYSYDPVGNISSIVDAAQQTVYFSNQAVSASGNYVYDAVYRLFKAEGREHVGNPGAPPETNYNDVPRVHRPLPGDGHAMRHYCEQYRYDAVGNILELLHSAAGEGSWRRRYEYDQIASNNRLTKTSVGQLEERYAYDAHGNMTRMQHLPSMKWSFKDQLASTQTQVVNVGQTETTYYIYDSGGRRARKVTDSPSGHRRADRIYLGGFEMYREYAAGADSVVLECTTLHLMDDKRRIALVEMRDQETAIRYQFDNHLGSAFLELDDAASVITYEEYHPFGSTSYQAGRSVAEVSLKRYRFTGKERDEETGLNYHGARYYAAWLGRWTACDPSGIEDGLNLFVYVKDNPINNVDLTGDFSVSWGQVAIGAGLAVLAVGAVVLTAGALGPAVVGGIAAVTGVSEATVVTTVAVAGTAYGTYSTKESVGEIRHEIATGTNLAGEKVTDDQISRQIGGTAVGAIATLVGLKGIKTGGGPPTQLARAATAGGPEGFFGSLLVRPVSVPQASGVSVPQAAAAVVGLSSGLATQAPVLMSSMGGGGGGGGGGSDDSGSGRGSANRERKISRDTAKLELREALESETLTPRQREIIDLLEAEYGKEAIAKFRETGELPSGVENSHPYSVAVEPELASRPGDLVPKNFHRYGVHPGDTTIPLHGDPLAPDYVENSGFQILNENGEPIGSQAGESYVDQYSDPNHPLVCGGQR